jgi:hypothetical protein
MPAEWGKALGWRPMPLHTHAHAHARARAHTRTRTRTHTHTHTHTHAHAHTHTHTRKQDAFLALHFFILKKKRTYRNKIELGKLTLSPLAYSHHAVPQCDWGQSPLLSTRDFRWFSIPTPVWLREPRLSTKQTYHSIRMSQVSTICPSPIWPLGICGQTSTTSPWNLYSSKRDK